MEGGYHENGPKRRRQTRRLGHRYVFFKNFFLYYDIKAIFYVYIGGNLRNTDEEGDGRW
jgi:hypothetical protein